MKNVLNYFLTLEEKKLEPEFYYSDKIQYQIQCKTNYKIHNLNSSV